MQVTLDPVYCTLAIEAGRHRQTFRRRGRTQRRANPDEVNCGETVLEFPGADVAFNELLTVRPESGDPAEMGVRGRMAVTDFPACYARELSSVIIGSPGVAGVATSVCRLHFVPASHVELRR